jgi:hypothetical protein
VALSVIAMRGYKGPVVERIQKQLNKLHDAGLEPDGDFGSKTEEAVKSFQKAYGFMSDGIVGPFTDAALSTTLFARHLPRVPPHVHQGDLLRCWAASTESWLRAQSHRTHYTQEQIVKGMQDDGFARANGSLPVSNQRVWEDRVGLRPITETGSSFFAERVLSRLELEKRPLLLGLGGSVGHVVVMFGVVVNGLDIEILVMDPMSSPADHPVRRKVTDIQKLKGNVVTWMHKMPLMI